MSNIIKAIYNIYHCPVYKTGEHYYAKNRANNMGDALEHFIKDSFANSYGLDEEDAMRAHSEIFAYLGNQNNPPDAILRGGDAIEVKKIESSTSALALNSSYPKAKIYRDSTMLTTACKSCDGGAWDEKDLIFAVGVVKNDEIKQLCFDMAKTTQPVVKYTREYGLKLKTVCLKSLISNLRKPMNWGE